MIIARISALKWRDRLSAKATWLTRKINRISLGPPRCERGRMRRRLIYRQFHGKWNLKSDETCHLFTAEFPLVRKAKFSDFIIALEKKSFSSAFRRNGKCWYRFDLFESVFVEEKRSFGCKWKGKSCLRYKNLFSSDFSFQCLIVYRGIQIRDFEEVDRLIFFRREVIIKKESKW